MLIVQKVDQVDSSVRAPNGHNIDNWGLSDTLDAAGERFELMDFLPFNDVP